MHRMLTDVSVQITRCRVTRRPFRTALCAVTTHRLEVLELKQRQRSRLTVNPSGCFPVSLVGLLPSCGADASWFSVFSLSHFYQYYTIKNPLMFILIFFRCELTAFLLCVFLKCRFYYHFFFVCVISPLRTVLVILLYILFYSILYCHCFRLFSV